jgi:hypothetical protein
VLVAVALIVLVNGYWIWFVGAEQTLYSWDHVAYWSMTSGLAERLPSEPVASLRAVARSIAEHELNLLPSLPLAPFLTVAGSTRLAWVLTVTNVYAIPALLLGWWAVRHIVGWNVRPPEDSRTMPSGLAWLVAIGWLAPLWEPVGLGYLGVGGMGLIFVVYGLAFRRSAGSDREQNLSALAIGVALAMLLLFRRWYAFWSFAWCVVLVVDATASMLRGRTLSWATLRRSFGQPTLVAIGLAGTLLLVAAPRVRTMLDTDYTGRFVHYDSLTSPSAEVLNLIGRFGIAPLCVIAMAGLAAARSRRLRRPVIVIAGHSVLVALMFRVVQDPSPQHWYLVIPGMLTIAALGFMSVRLRGWIGGCLVLGALVTSLGVVGRWAALPPPFWPAIRIEPAVRTDLDEVERLLQFLDGRIAMGAGWVYVLSGTGAVSGSGLGFANWSLEADHPSCGRILQTDQIDLRDGFPDGLFVSDIVVVPSPIQVRGSGVTQRVVAIPADDFLFEKGLARAFVRLPVSFALDGGVQVLVFERVRPNTPAEIQSLSDRLREHYRDNPFVYGPSEEIFPDPGDGSYANLECS